MVFVLVLFLIIILDFEDPFVCTCIYVAEFLISLCQCLYYYFRINLRFYVR